MTSRALKASCGLFLLTLGGCEAAKSSNPTAPTVAGPIAGVTISAPALLEPAQGFKFKESEQPIRLVVQNATTTGVRSLSYTFEVGSDSGFTTKVFARSGVAPGDAGGSRPRGRAFRPPGAPAKPPPPGNPPPTRSCDSLVNDKQKLVECIHAAVNPASGSAEAAFEVTKRVAWALRGEGAGELIKNGGENIVSWQGYSFAAGRICYPDGHIYKVVSDVGGAK